MSRYLGIDLGDKTIGLAVSDPLKITAQGLLTIKRTKLKEDLEKISKIIEEYDIEKIILGLPKNMNNTIGPQAMRVISFKNELAKVTDIEIFFEDERMTTLQSESVLIKMNVRRENRKKYVDKIAASFILQTYLERNRK